MNWNSTVVVTANCEVQTDDEAPENVHDLDLLVTVQILDDTPAVLARNTGVVLRTRPHKYIFRWRSWQCSPGNSVHAR